MDPELEPDIRLLVSLAQRAMRVERRIIEKAIARHGDDAGAVVERMLCEALGAIQTEPASRLSAPEDRSAPVQEEGRQAFRKGQPVNANPYRAAKRTWRARAWEAGWREEAAQGSPTPGLVLPQFLLEPLPSAAF